MSAVGYGDISASSDAGKEIVLLLIICGCALYAVIIGKGATLIWRKGEAKLRDDIQHHLKNHIVIMEEGNVNVVRELFEEIMAAPHQDPRKRMYVSSHEKNPVVDLGVL